CARSYYSYCFDCW
nr:immunoglobulin heavy chain junction region [Mus musculus]